MVGSGEIWFGTVRFGRYGMAGFGRVRQGEVGLGMAGRVGYDVVR